MKPASRLFILTLCAGIPFMGAFAAQSLEEESNDYMREELGVNEFTTPSIAWLMKELDTFQPVPMSVVKPETYDTVFSNRLQTALHFGSLIGDGFIVVTNQQRSEIQNIGRALLRQAKAMGVGSSLTRRSNKLLQLGDSGDWSSLRTELVGTQKDVEKAMIELRDEQMAHMISLGGWLKGFYGGTVATDEHYTPQRAEVLKKPDIIDYYLDRLSTLHPNLKKTQFVKELVSQLQSIQKIAIDSQDRPLTRPEVAEMRKRAEEINRILLSKVDSEGNIQK